MIRDSWEGLREFLTDRLLRREAWGDARALLASTLVRLAWRVQWRAAWYEAEDLRRRGL